MSDVKMKECKHHGISEHVKRKSGRYRCRKCSVDAVSARRRRVKKELVDMLGGECSICGYNRYQGALEFHHKNPEEKEFTISKTGLTRSNKKLLDEVKKCILVCNRCHVEIHGGVIDCYGNELDNIIDDHIYLNSIINIKSNDICLKCGCVISNNTKNKLCSKCYSITRRKIERPSLDQLLIDVNELGYSGTGRKYNVSDNTIRKWIKNYKKGM